MDKLDIRPGEGSQAIFPICGKCVAAHCGHGSVLAKTTWPVPAKAAWAAELDRLRPQAGHFLLVVATDGNG